MDVAAFESSVKICVSISVSGGTGVQTSHLRPHQHQRSLEADDPPTSPQTDSSGHNAHYSR